MFRFTHGIIACGLLAAIGCQQGTSTAPATSTGTGRSESAVRKLTVTVRDYQSVTQDRTGEVSVLVNRSHFSGPVEVSLRNLPTGVTLETKDRTVPADKNTLTLTIKAAPDAPPVSDHAAQVVAKAKDQADMPEAVADFKLTVKAK